MAYSHYIGLHEDGYSIRLKGPFDIHIKPIATCHGLLFHEISEPDIDRAIGYYTFDQEEDVITGIDLTAEGKALSFEVEKY